MENNLEQKMKVVPEWTLREKVDKTKILYNDIDAHVQKICKLFNQLPFLATTSSCEGHPRFNGSDWFATGGISLEVYEEERWHILIALFDTECQADYEYFNIGISKGLRYSTQGFIFFTEGISWSAQGLTKEECEERLQSTWCKLEFYLRKYIELEIKGIDWIKHLKWRRC